MLWNRPSFDENIFDMDKKKFYCDSNEIEDILNQVDDFPEKISVRKWIASLLRQTKYFLDLTSTEPAYQSDEYKKTADEANEEIFNPMYKKLKSVQDIIKEGPNFGAIQDKLLSSSISYCIESIERRIDELKKAKDPTYDYWQKSSLREFIAEKYPVIAKRHCS